MSREGYQAVMDLVTARESDLEETDLDPRSIAAEGLDALAREGACRLLQVALEIEVREFLGRHPYQRSETAQEGYRNGHRGRILTCGSGSFEVQIPKVTGAERPFSVRSIPSYQRSSDLIMRALPLLYAEGLSTRDFERALKPFWNEAGLSRSSISRANQQLHVEFDAWRRRDLSRLKVLYLFLDGVNERVRFGSAEKEGVLVAHAILEDGSRELLTLELGPQETEEDWRGLLQGMIGRGLKPPQLVVSDGAPGLIKAVKEVWKDVPRQRCTAHKTRNVLGRVPRKHERRVKQDLTKIIHAIGLEGAIRAAGAFLNRYGREFPTACEVLAKDLDDCLTFYCFPEAHWKRIRTSNVIERAFKEARRRTRVVGRFPTEKSAMALIWASIEHDRLKWRGIQMDATMLEAAWKVGPALAMKPIHVKCAKQYLKVA